MIRKRVVSARHEISACGVRSIDCGSIDIRIRECFRGYSKPVPASTAKIVSDFMGDIRRESGVPVPVQSGDGEERIQFKTLPFGAFPDHWRCLKVEGHTHAILLIN